MSVPTPTIAHAGTLTQTQMTEGPGGGGLTYYGIWRNAVPTTDGGFLTCSMWVHGSSATDYLGAMQVFRVHPDGTSAETTVNFTPWPPTEFGTFNSYQLTVTDASRSSDVSFALVDQHTAVAAVLVVTPSNSYNKFLISISVDTGAVQVIAYGVNTVHDSTVKNLQTLGVAAGSGHVVASYIQNGQYYLDVYTASSGVLTLERGAVLLPSHVTNGLGWQVSNAFLGQGGGRLGTDATQYGLNTLICAVKPDANWDWQVASTVDGSLGPGLLPFQYTAPEYNMMTWVPNNTVPYQNIPVFIDWSVSPWRSYIGTSGFTLDQPLAAVTAAGAGYNSSTLNGVTQGSVTWFVLFDQYGNLSLIGWDGASQSVFDYPNGFYWPGANFLTVDTPLTYGFIPLSNGNLAITWGQGTTNDPNLYWTIYEISGVDPPLRLFQRDDILGPRPTPRMTSLPGPNQAPRSRQYTPYPRISQRDGSGTSGYA